MANDRLLGYGFLGAVSDNGSGKIRVTLAGRTLSKRVYDLLSAGHYLGNIDQADLAAITAKGGDPVNGYWFDTEDDYSGTSWTSAHRYHPFRQNAIYTYATAALLRAAAATEDTAFVGFSTVGETTDWNGEVLNNATNMLDWYGMAGRRSIMNNCSHYPSGAVSNTTRQVVVADMRFVGHYGTSNLIIGFNDTGGNSLGVLYYNCEFYGGGSYLFYLKAGNNEVVAFKNCAFIGCGGTQDFTKTAKFYNSAFLYCNTGINNGSKANTWVNTIVYKPLSGAACWAGLTNATVANIASSDDTASGAGAVINVSKTQMALWSDNDNGHHEVQCRSKADYALATLGTTGGEVPTADIDDNNISAASPIGPHKGATQYKVTWPAAAEVDPLASAFTTFAGAVTPALDLPAIGNVTPNDTLRNVTGESTYKSPAQEALDNTDPGVGFVQREADGGPASYKHLGVTKTPALNTSALEAAAYAIGYAVAEALYEAWELARNGLIATGKVLLGWAYRQFGVDYEGTLPGTPAAPATPTGLAISDLGTGKGGRATISNAASFASTDELIVTDGAPVTGVKASAELGMLPGNLTVTAKTAGVAGNSITVQFVNADEDPNLVEVGTAITVRGRSEELYCGGLADLFNGESGYEGSTLVDATQTGGTDAPSFDFLEGTAIPLAGGVDAFAPTVIGRGTFAEYALNGGIICPNVTMNAARTGDKAKAASGLTSASESAYSTAAASWTPTDPPLGGSNFNGGLN